jgi:hypothetical protein
MYPPPHMREATYYCLSGEDAIDFSKTNHVRDGAW